MLVLTFSRTFPVYHPQAGQPTHFVEKIWQSLYNQGIMSQSHLYELSRELGIEFDLGMFDPKEHTIRKGKRWKVGDTFTPRIWSGKPYGSKQIQIAQVIEVKKEAAEVAEVSYMSCGDANTCGCMGNCEHASAYVNKRSILNIELK